MDSRFALSTIMYLLLVLMAPMGFMSSPARAEQTPLKDTAVTGPGEYLPHQLHLGHCLTPPQSSVLISELPTRVWV